jgi:hypothetical protein
MKTTRRVFAPRRAAGAPFLHRVASLPEKIDQAKYPFNIHAFSRGIDLAFRSKVTSLLSLDGEAIPEINYRETKHFLITRDFLNSPERFFRHLFGTVEDTGTDASPALQPSAAGAIMSRAAETRSLDGQNTWNKDAFEHSMSDLPDHVRRNRALWDNWAQQYVAPGEEHWAAAEPTWGIWGVSESELGVLPDDLEGKDVIELGCGTAYISAWLLEVRPAAGATTRYPFVTLEWAGRWPCEEVWKARRCP